MEDRTVASAGNGQRALGALAVALAVASLGVAVWCGSLVSTARASTSDGSVWVGTWSASQQITEPRNMPPAPGLSGNTLRQVVHASLGGKRIRVRLSNAFGNDSVVIGGASIATAATGSGIVPGSNTELTFGGRRAVTIAAGGTALSDDLTFDVEPLSNVAVTMFVIAAPAQLTGHPGSRTTSYIVPGDQHAALEMPNAVRAEHWYLLAGIDVQRERGSAVVVLGNSIADGRGSGTDKQNRWPDNLARRLQQDARTPDVAVLNSGIGGNCVLKACLGPAGVERLERDVLSQPGAKWLIVSEGVNDIGGAKGINESAAVSLGLINAYQDIIKRAHERDIRVYGATILPFEGSQYGSPEHEAARQRVNEWIRKGRAFDAVVDLDAVMRDPETPTRLRADVDGGDHLHPNENGYRVMADAIDMALFTSASQRATALRLSKLFSDGVVLQRRVRIPVWGWAEPNAKVTVSFRGQSASAAADSDGRWSVRLPPAEAGGPFELRVDAGDQHLRVADVMVGDVWVASGQSNMELTVSVAANAAQEIASAHDSLLREFKVPISWSEEPSDELAGGSWAPADPQHVGTFSAVAYSFARELRKSEHVPIGIVHTSWGGSAIETWLSAASQGLPEDGPARALATERARMESARSALVARLAGVPAHDPGLANGVAAWADPALDETGWQPIKVPALWETQGYDGMDGVAWYRTSFTLTPEEAAQGGTLSLGPVDDDDITWVNGVEIGRTNGYNKPRTYAVPASALRAGTNVLAVRVVDYQGGGGIYGSADSLRLTIGGAAHPLAGTWKFRVGELSMGMDGQRLNKVPAITYNKMLRPLLPFPIKGVIWYQGESNANNVKQAAAYREQLAKLVTSWREAWRGSGSSPTLPFFWVQLPNYGARDAAPPTESGWATIRESMTSALRLPKTGQAITIDVGGGDELHPKNKQDVGRRLALVARRVAYGEAVESSGPTFKSFRVDGARVILRFDHVGAGLTTRGGGGGGGGFVDGFAIAGADKRFVWAKAKIEGNHVVVWSDEVTKPLAVRYAWMNDPEGALLFSTNGLPAAPFRTDAW